MNIGSSKEAGGRAGNVHPLERKLQRSSGKKDFLQALETMLELERIARFPDEIWTDSDLVLGLLSFPIPCMNVLKPYTYK